MKEPITVYKATTRHGQICHFGEHSTATAWARGGTVEQVELPAPNELSVVGGKELRKYYFHTTSPAVGQPGHSGYYLASEADAAFAEKELRNINLQYQRDGLCIQIMVMEQQAEKDRDLIAQMSYGAADEISEMRRQHAEEMKDLHDGRDASIRSYQRENDRLRAEHAEYVAHTNTECSKAITALKIAHAEEVERLNFDHAAQTIALRSRIDSYVQELTLQYDQLRDARKQAEASNEEIERLKRDRDSWKGLAEINADDLKEHSDEIESLRKQAERYEKLRKITPTEFERIFWDSDDTDSSFDALVDKLPASGEASAEVQASRTE